MRSILASASGLAVTAAAAVVLGDYPLSGAVPWAAAVVIPFLIASAMLLVAGTGGSTAPARRRRTIIWSLTGPLAVISLAWGFRVATGYGLDPLPTSCWIAGAFGLAWPPAWGLLRARSRRTAPTGTPAG